MILAVMILVFEIARLFIMDHLCGTGGGGVFDVQNY